MLVPLKETLNPKPPKILKIRLLSQVVSHAGILVHQPSGGRPYIILGLYKGYIGLYRGHIGLYMGHIGLYKGHIGLYRGHIRLYRVIKGYIGIICGGS